MSYKMSWFAGEISPEHADLPVRQVYAWIYTEDGKVVIVSKDNIKWQFPGGHPLPQEALSETLVREVEEETSLNIDPTNAIFFGYYVIEDFKLNEKYLQVRYLVKLEEEDLVLKPNEKDSDTDTAHIVAVRVVNPEELEQKISWVKESDEYKTVKHYLK